MIVDVITYNGEKDLLDLRLNILNDVVDQFIIVEAPTTFSGRAKPLYFGKQIRHFKEFLPKIKHHVIKEDYTEEEIALADSSPNTQGAHHWQHEFLQKERIKQALTHLRDDDVVFIGDVDEVWNPEILPAIILLLPDGKRCKLDLLVYTYWLNNRSDEKFRGTLVARYVDLLKEPLNHYRSWPQHHTYLTTDEYSQGWHFTSMGGPEALRKKLIDQYTDESYATKEVLDKLSDIYGKEDFLGRDFTYEIDTREWPKYLKDNVDKYKHLCYN